MSRDFKERLYRDYYATHVRPRKAPLDTKRLTSIAKSMEFQFGEFLPTDQSARVLDVGCGSGGLVNWLQQRGFANAGGIDLSEDQIKTGTELGIANLQLESLEEHLQRPSRRYDVIFLRDVLEHIERDEVLDFLDLCHDGLTDGGRIIVQVPNGSSPFFGRVRYGDFGHSLAFTASSLSQLFRLTGFTNFRFKPFESRPVRMPPHRRLFTAKGLKLTIRQLSWRMVRTFYRFLLFAELGSWDHIVTYNLIACAEKRSPGDRKQEGHGI
jgi:2-polyprenyl-3-methyl-5-hydroxy-6-metoxy-1,4-benzoquinol methylase